MAVIEKERVEERQASEASAPTRRFGVVMTVLAVIAVAAVAAAAILLTTGGEEATQAVATRTAPELRSEQRILADLANQGYIPSEAVDWRLHRTEQLVNQGLVPAETLEANRSPVEPLFSESELLMIELAESGQIPMQAVDWGKVELKKLVNQGLIPRDALND